MWEKVETTLFPVYFSIPTINITSFSNCIRSIWHGLTKTPEFSCRIPIEPIVKASTVHHLYDKLYGGFLHQALSQNRSKHWCGPVNHSKSVYPIPFHLSKLAKEGIFQNWGNHCQPAGLMNPAPERGSPEWIVDPRGKKKSAQN